MKHNGAVTVNNGNLIGKNAAGLAIYGNVGVEINGGNLVGNKFGIYNTNSGIVNMYGGTAQGNIYDGICLGSGATANIGNPSSVVDSTSPILIGKNYGIAIADGSTANFYKGSLKGTVAGYYGTITPRNGYTLQTVQKDGYYITTLK